MSLRQVKSLLSAIEQRRAADDQRLLCMLRAAQASDKAFRKLLESLGDST